LYYIYFITGKARDQDQKLSRSRSEPKLVEEVSQADITALKREAARVKLQRRRWWHADGYKDKLSSAQGSLVTVATYNVLAQNLLEDNKWLYRDCDKEGVLDWESRKHQLLRDMKQYDFDVGICETRTLLGVFPSYR
jgi:hypothetical protein